MTADDDEIRDGLEAVFLVAWRRLSPAERSTDAAALERVAEGQPLENAMVEGAIECGMSPAQARRTVRQAIERADTDPGDWRRVLT